MFHSHRRQKNLVAVAAFKSLLAPTEKRHFFLSTLPELNGTAGQFEEETPFDISPPFITRFRGRPRTL